MINCIFCQSQKVCTCANLANISMNTQNLANQNYNIQSQTGQQVLNQNYTFQNYATQGLVHNLNQGFQSLTVQLPTVKENLKDNSIIILINNIDVALSQLMESLPEDTDLKPEELAAQVIRALKLKAFL